MNQWVLFVAVAWSSGPGLFHTADTKPWHFDTQAECEAMAKTLGPIFHHKCQLNFVEKKGNGTTISTAR